MFCILLSVVILVYFLKYVCICFTQMSQYRYFFLCSSARPVADLRVQQASCFFVSVVSDSSTIKLIDTKFTTAGLF